MTIPLTQFVNVNEDSVNYFRNHEDSGIKKNVRKLKNLWVSSLLYLSELINFSSTIRQRRIWTKSNLKKEKVKTLWYSFAINWLSVVLTSILTQLEYSSDRAESVREPQYIYNQPWYVFSH